MRKIVTVYLPVGSVHGDTTAYPTFESADKAARRTLPGWYPNGYTIESRQFELPDGAFWTNDLISVELHRGGQYSDPDESILTGGKWMGPVYGLVRVSTISLSRNTVDGYIVEPGTDRHIQSLELASGKNGFPYRNAKLVRANDVEAFM